MKKRPFMTSMRTDKNIMKYDINGRVYEFIVIKIDNGMPYGYCYKTKKYAWLYPDSIITEGEIPVLATLI